VAPARTRRVVIAIDPPARADGVEDAQARREARGAETLGLSAEPGRLPDEGDGIRDVRTSAFEDQGTGC
jgi:hypothetical protein